MASKQAVCTHDWGSVSGISQCADCGALGSYFPGGDRGEPAFRASVPGSVVARARQGDVVDLVAALPSLRNGAWWLPEADWAALLRSIHTDIDTWRAALSRASGDVAFFDRALALEQLAPANVSVAVAAPHAVHHVDLEGRLALDAVGRGFAVLALDAGGAAFWSAKRMRRIEGIGDGRLYRVGPACWVEAADSPSRHLHRLDPSGGRRDTADLPGQDDPDSQGAFVDHRCLDGGQESFFVGFSPPPLSGECPVGWVQVRDEHDVPLATWRTRGRGPVGTPAGYVSFHDVAEGVSYPVTLRDHALSILARSEPGPYFHGSRFAEGRAPGPDGAIATTYGAHEGLAWTLNGGRLVAHTAQVWAAARRPRTDGLSFYVRGHLFHGQGCVGFAPDDDPASTPEWREDATLVDSATRGPHAGMVSLDGLRFRMAHVETGARAPWLALGPPPTAVHCVGTGTGLRVFADRRAWQLTWGQPPLELGPLPKPLRPDSHFLHSNITLLGDVSSRQERYLCLTDGSTVRVPDEWVLLGPHDHGWGPVYLDAARRLLLFGPFPTTSPAATASTLGFQPS